MKNYLVFEANVSQEMRYENGRAIPTGIPISYSNAIGVKAKDATQACTFVMGKTRRISRYAVIEAEFINFEDSLFDNEPEAERPTLNP